MSKAYEFLKECGSFFVLSINGDYPAGRPFGAIMEVGEDLYLATNDMNHFLFGFFVFFCSNFIRLFCYYWFFFVFFFT